MQISTTSGGFQRFLAANSTDGSFASKIPTITEPTNAGVLDAGNGGSTSQNICLLAFFGAGSATNTFDVRLIGWRKTRGGLWFPVPIFQGTCTLSTMTGVGTQDVASTDLIVDTITAATGFSSIGTVEVVSPTGNIPAHIKVDFAGFQKIELIFSITNATNGNALIAQY